MYEEPQALLFGLSVEIFVPRETFLEKHKAPEGITGSTNCFTWNVLRSLSELLPHEQNSSFQTGNLQAMLPFDRHRRQT